jgi:hypothetical protein
VITDLHFICLVMQLRNLVWATSNHDVYLMSNFSIIHWSSLTCSKSEVLNVSGHVAPSEVGVARDFCLTNTLGFMSLMSSLDVEL